MREFQDKRKTERLLYSRLTIIILLIILLLLARGTWNIYQKDLESVRDLDITNKQLADLQSRNNYLNGEVSKLQTTSGQEEEIREKFQVAQPGENVIIIVPTASQATTSVPSSSFAENVWRFIKNIF